MNASVSVIIPAYCAAGTIGRAIDSLVAQIHPPEQMIVVDDGSPENLETALAPYRHRITLLRQANGGAASARNRGIEHATGEFIAFLDADDYWEPAKLKRQLEVFRQHPHVGLVASRYFVQYPGRPRETPPPDDGSLYDCVLPFSSDRILDVLTRISTPTIIARRAAIGQHRFDTSLGVAEDRDLWIRLLVQWPAYILSEPLATVVFEPASLSRSDPDVGYSPMIDVARRYARFVSRRSLRSFEAMVYRGWASAHLNQGRPRAALAPACHRLRRQWQSPEAWWIVLKCIGLSWAHRRPGSMPSRVSESLAPGGHAQGRSTPGSLGDPAHENVA